MTRLMLAATGHLLGILFIVAAAMLIAGLLVICSWD